MTTSRVAVQLLVRGVVQMVGYRLWTTRTARALGLTGFVRNLKDGRVEIFAEGDARAIDELVDSCWQGPVAARVEDVTRAQRTSRGATAFVQVADATAPDGT